MRRRLDDAHDGPNQLATVDAQPHRPTRKRQANHNILDYTRLRRARLCRDMTRLRRLARGKPRALVRGTRQAAGLGSQGGFAATPTINIRTRLCRDMTRLRRARAASPRARKAAAWPAASRGPWLTRRLCRDTRTRARVTRARTTINIRITARCAKLGKSLCGVKLKWKTSVDRAGVDCTVT